MRKRKTGKVQRDWVPEYVCPYYWGSRTPLWSGMPRIINLYLDSNDNKLRIFLAKQKGLVLDAGCGSGRFLDYADVGVDFSKGMILKAKRYQKGLVVASLLHLPFRGRVFKTAFTVDVLIHVKPDARVQATEELQRAAEKVYNFLSAQRSILYPLWLLLNPISFKPFGKLLPYIALLIAFPVDRMRRLKIY